MSKMVHLISGHQMPIIGFGTYKIQGYDLIYTVLEAALAAGYRSIDTASVYRNESDIGKALKILLPKYNLERKDIFITSKLGPSEQGKGNAKAALLGSIQRLDCEYLDLYLIHWPGTSQYQPKDEHNRQLRKESWLDMEEAFKQGKVKSLGISNYLTRHIEELLSYCTVKPSVLQTEYHPHLIQADVKKTCDKHNILLQAYSSLGTTSSKELISDPKVVEIAKQCQKSPAQVLLCWAVQQDIGVLPKSTNPSHIRDNFDIFSFSLTSKQMEELSHLNKEAHYCWDPSKVA
ncbi:aldose reductase A-like [Biomphalaria glabrata]|uniref:Aldose reductase A-like n=1 Tax=Biomphalaria glabrata TaxID=6526 RepID=A0A2C9KAS7_BIOGL|nr:aldose reductase A-like [Biomphalaria glabrata]KAI8777502.1 aldose reductase A [Biomphalaria glabrata]